MISIHDNKLHVVDDYYGTDLNDFSLVNISGDNAIVAGNKGIILDPVDKTTNVNVLISPAGLALVNDADEVFFKTPGYDGDSVIAAFKLATSLIGPPGYALGKYIQNGVEHYINLHTDNDHIFVADEASASTYYTIRQFQLVALALAANCATIYSDENAQNFGLLRSEVVELTGDISDISDDVDGLRKEMKNFVAW